MKLSTTVLGVCLALAMPRAEAATQEIRALFQPDPSQPSKNVFVNKTPNSGYCASYPGECEQNSMFSIQLPVLMSSQAPLQPGDAIPIRVPANWRQLTVTNADTQETEVVEVRITGIGSNFILSHTAAELTGETNNLTAHQALWEGSSWVYAPAPCRYSGVGFYGSQTYRFFWKAPVEADCTKVARFTIPQMTFNTMDFAYELRTPNPLGMSSGLYTGSINYTLGPAGDFTFGSSFTPDDGNLTLDFVLDVQHTLKVELPPGGNRVSLEPAGGWAPWIESGKKPTEIFRDQPFYLSASSRFKVMLLCNSPGGNTCRLGSPKGNATDIQVAITLPPGITGSSGYNVTRMPLQYNSWVGPFQPSLYVDRKVGSLNFYMTPFAINFLLKPGVNDKLRGNITIIWDSEA